MHYGHWEITFQLELLCHCSSKMASGKRYYTSGEAAEILCNWDDIENEMIEETSSHSSSSSESEDGIETEVKEVILTDDEEEDGTHQQLIPPLPHLSPSPPPLVRMEMTPEATVVEDNEEEETQLPQLVPLPPPSLSPSPPPFTKETTAVEDGQVNFEISLPAYMPSQPPSQPPSPPPRKKVAPIGKVNKATPCCLAAKLLWEEVDVIGANSLPFSFRFCPPRDPGVNTDAFHENDTALECFELLIPDELSDFPRTMINNYAQSNTAVNRPAKRRSVYTRWKPVDKYEML